MREALQLVDMGYAATFEGKDAAIAAIGLTSPYWMLMIACWVGSSNGLTSLLSSALGAHEGRRIEQLVLAARWIIAVLAVSFIGLAASIWFSEAPSGRSPELHRDFRIYGTVLIGGMSITAFWSVLPDSIVKMHHDTKSTMWAGLLSGITNVVLNTVFVFAFHWGIFGIALATVLARIASLSYAIGRARAHEQRRIASGLDDQPGVFESLRGTVHAILRIALPAALTFALMALETRLVLLLLERQPDDVAVLSAWALFDRALRFASMPVIAVGVAMLPLTARLWGQGDLAGIRSELAAGTRGLLAYTLLLITPLLLLAAPWIARQVNSEPTAQDYTTLGLRLVPLGLVCMSPTFFLRSTFEGLQRPRPGLVAALVRTLGLVVPLVWLGLRLAPELGASPILGAYAGFLLGTLLPTIALAHWLHRTVR